MTIRYSLGTKKPPGLYELDPETIKELNILLKEDDKEPKKKKEVIIQPKAPIISSNEFWTIPEVQYRNTSYNVDLLKTLLDNGNKKTQDEWVEYSLNNEFKVADFPLYYAIFNTLYKNKNNPQTEEIRNFIKDNMFNYYLITLTRFKYNPKGKDKIIHNYKQSDKYEIDENIIGPDDFIKKLNEPATLNAILGNNNVQEINDTFNWITKDTNHDLNTRLWRLNSKPTKIEECIGRFDADSGRVGLLCGRYPTYSGSSLGVRRAHENL